MTDGPEGTPGGAQPQAGTPSPRALGAMESAVRRVRANTGAPGDAPTPPDPYRPPPPPVGRPGGFGSRWTGGRSDRWLVAAVVVAAVAVVALAVALVLSLGGGGSHLAAPPGSTAAAANGAARHHPAGHAPVTPTSSTTSTTLAATPGGPPVIDALSPSSGAAGQSITITGANFLSSDGHIVAAFNGQVASTSCPSSTTCTVTVPPAGGPGPAQVTITTAAGASNPVTFTYS